MTAALDTPAARTTGGARTPRHGVRLLAAAASVSVAVAGTVVAPHRAVATASTVMTRASGSTLVGITHTQVDADSWRAPAAVARARQTLETSTSVQAQAIMGWGALNPEPSPGVFNWTSLDQRVRLMVSTSARPVITLCCSPDWMKNAAAGKTDWTRIEAAPTAAHYADFAKLAVAVAKRYPQVHFFQVWNELKGFYDRARNNWNIAAYTRMYNQVYAALKRFNPKLNIGGPYVPMDSWRIASAGGYPSNVRGSWGIVDRRSLDAVQYWLDHKVGAQFVTVDGSSRNRDEAATKAPVTALSKFSAIDRWIRSKTSLPIWWSEFYVGLPASTSIHSSAGTRVMLAGIAMAAATGARVVLLWDPETYPTSDSPGLWCSTRSATGGQPTALARALRLLKPILGPTSQKLVVRAGPAIWTLTNGARSFAVTLSEHWSS